MDSHERTSGLSFELDGQKFTALNGGPAHKFNEAVSFVVRCETQAEVDYYWEKLTAGGEEIACGWLRDKFGLCWQITPSQLPSLVRHPKAMQAMMKMKKIDLAELERAAQSRSRLERCDQNGLNNNCLRRRGGSRREREKSLPSGARR